MPISLGLVAAGIVLSFAVRLSAEEVAALATRPASAPSDAVREDVERTYRATFGVSSASEIRSLILQLVTRRGREATSPLVDLLVRPDREHLPRSFVAETLVELSDPDGKRGLKPMIEELRRVDWDGLTVAALAAPGDDFARDQLLRLAPLRDRKAVYALGFLRTFDSKNVRPRVVALFPNQTGDWRTNFWLAAFLASQDYAESLKDPKGLETYHDFESRLWRAWALAAKDTVGSFEYDRATSALLKNRKDGDERFIQRILTEPKVTHEELTIAKALSEAQRKP